MLDQKGSESDKRRIIQIFAKANFFGVKFIVILRAGVLQSIVFGIKRLNQNAPLKAPASGAPGNLCQKLKGSFGRAKIRQPKSCVN
jgi:hypothetical protein